MADILDFTENTAPASDDALYLVNDADGTPSDNYVTIANFFGNIATPVNITAGGAFPIKIAQDQINETTQTSRFGSRHYTRSEEPFGIMFQSSATENTISIGGGTSLLNAATRIRFLTAANNFTVTGTERFLVDNTTGATGGAVSAGAGNQYVELTIAGTRYKILHDGAV
jgi:hypothetical protein